MPTAGSTPVIWCAPMPTDSSISSAGCGAMIKTAGANVSAAEVEKAIAKVTGGAPAYVVGIPDAERGQLVAAVVVRPDGAAAFDEAALRERLKTELSAYKIPKRFVVPAPRRSTAVVQRQGRHAATAEAVRWLTRRAHHRRAGAVSRRPRRGQADGDRSRASRVSYRELDIDHKRFGCGIHRGRRRQGHPGRADHAQQRPLGAGRRRADPHRRRAGAAEHPAASRANWSRSCGSRPCSSW